MTGSDSVLSWLLDSDPSIRWQVMRDLLGAPESEWWAERAKVETEGWGARLLSYEDEDGQWAGGSFVPSDFDYREWQETGQPWTATGRFPAGFGSTSTMESAGLPVGSICGRRGSSNGGRRKSSNGTSAH